MSSTEPARRSAKHVAALRHQHLGQQQSSMDPPSHTPTPAAKVAIPPLRPRLDPAPPPSAAEKRRTPKACVECRTRKIKCNGKRPTCEHCEQCQIPCVYAEGKREQNKRATERSDRLLQLLGDISREVSLPPHLQQKIRAIESESTQILEDDTSVRSLQTIASKRRRKSSGSAVPEKLPRSSSPTLQGEADVSADVGSEESVDIIEEDFNRSEKARATGFIGKNSEVAWARRLSQAQHGGIENDVRGNSYGKPGKSEEAQRDRLSARKERHAAETQKHPPISDFTYHLDTENVLTFDHVDKDELPPPQVARHLLDHYMDTVQDALPILSKSVFLDQYRRYSRAKNPESLPATWRAILNMVFAIGAKFSHLVNAPWRGDERDHLVYYTRALSLGMPGDAIVAHPDLQRIQVLGLVSFYYLTISQVSRSWVMIGLACRQAIALGLHLRNLDPHKDAVSKEKRIRVWWSLYYIENLLCETLGRPTAVDQRFCSTPAPAPIDEASLAKSGGKNLEEWNRCQSEASSTPASEDRKAVLDLESTPSVATNFRNRVQLAVISQKILVNLYSATTVQKSWERAQYEIVALGTELDQWYGGLPMEFRFAHSEDKNAFCREKILLGFGFYSTKILLNRPCLCRIDKRIQKQGQGSKNIDQERARECVMAARSMSDLLPDMDVPDVNWMYYNGPWWCIVHHLMQAMTVLMLELAFEMCHMKDLSVNQEGILHTARKLLRWLTMMAANGNESAKSACKQAEEQFKGFSPFEHIDTSDLVEMAERGSEPASEHLSKERKGSADFTPDRMQHSILGSSAQVSGTPDQTMEDPEQSNVPNHVTFQHDQEESWPHYTDEELWSTDWTVPVDSTWSTGVFHNMYDLSNPFMAFGNPLAPPFPLGVTLGSDASAAFVSHHVPHGNYEYEVATMSQPQQHHQPPTEHHPYQFSPPTQDQQQQHFVQSMEQQPHFQPPSTNDQWQQNPHNDH
ncbi:C6 transcription factor [Lasiodiplodia theobromae]|uniref:C6 transcription factor n=1 Tax=Lasiodiplodia theobromae TaxID=45133 RepID=UPI0015C38AB8|nr:C6 transcription factor [Lasiodiplodia theobromae]KAF4546085.1 C6 transcription factor [Lasiodiplodia theobromae]